MIYMSTTTNNNTIDYNKLKEEADKILEDLGVTYSINPTGKGYYIMFSFCEAPIYKLSFKNKELNDEAYKYIYNKAKDFTKEVAIGWYRTHKTLLEYCIENPIGVNSDYVRYSLIIE